MPAVRLCRRARASSARNSLKFVAASTHNLAITGLPSTPSAWTIEFWVYANGLAASTIFTTAGSGVRLLQGSSGTLTLGSTSTGAGWNIALTSSNSLSNAVWTHISIVGSGSNLALYVNGQSSATSSSMSPEHGGAELARVRLRQHHHVLDRLHRRAARLQRGQIFRQLLRADAAVRGGRVHAGAEPLRLRTTYSSAATNLTRPTSCSVTRSAAAGAGSARSTTYAGLQQRNLLRAQHAQRDGRTGAHRPARRIQRHQSVRQLPIVLITSYSTSGNWVDVNLMDVSWHKGNSSTQMVAYVEAGPV